MTISALCMLLQNDIINSHLSHPDLECDFTDGIHFLLPGITTDIPAEENFSKLYVCDLNVWNHYLKSSSINTQDKNTYIVCAVSTKKQEMLPSFENTSNIIYYRSPLSVLLNRLISILKQHSTVISEESIYNAFWTEVLNGRLMNEAAAFERIRHLPYPVHMFLSVIVIRSSLYVALDNNSSTYRKPIPVQQIIDALKEFFPYTNLFYRHTEKENEFIVLYSQDSRDSFDFDYPLHNFSYEAFSALLEKYHLCAGISNSSRAAETLRTMYLAAVTTLDLGHFLPEKPHYPGIYHHMEYMAYYVIHQCVPEFIRRNMHEDIIYLTHPAVIVVYQYDGTHNTDLLNVLFEYLSNGHNIAETASKLFMHRNTVLNKLNKIREITNLSIDNPKTQTSLLLSCQIIQYYQYYLKKKL